jgi:hypothetical protein
MSALVAVCAAAIFLPSGLHAQDIPSAYHFVETHQEGALFAGYTSFSTGRFGFGPKSVRTAGGRYTVQLSGPLALEGDASVLSGTRDVIDPDREEGARAVGEADVLLGSVDARFVLTLTGDRTWHRLAPFLSAGGGMIFDLSANDPTDEKLLPEDRFDFGSSFLGTLGAGSRLYLTDRFTLRGEGVFSLDKIDTPPGFSDPDRGFASVQEGEWVSGLHLTLSLGYRF